MPNYRKQGVPVSERTRLTMDRLVREPGWSGYRCVVSRLTSVRKFPFLEFAPCSQEREINPDR